MNAPTVLSARLLAQASRPVPGRAGAAPLPAALTRAALLLLPVLPAVAAAEAVVALRPPVVATGVLLGWASVQLLSHLGQVAAGRGAGVAAVARLVLSSFGAILAGWAVLLAVLPPGPAGTDRLPGYAVSGSLLALLACVAVGLATPLGRALLLWSLPSQLVAVAALGGWSPVPATPALLATLALPVGRAVAAAVHRPATSHRLTPADLARGGWYLALGLAQAGLVLSVVQAGAAWLPVAVLLVAAVPLVEVWTCWHLTRSFAGETTFDDRQPYLRHARRLAWVTLAPWVPLLVTGVALAGLAARLPYRLSAHPEPPLVVLSVAAGVLLPGVLALGVLLAARGLAGLATLLTAGPLAAVLATLAVQAVQAVPAAGAPGVEAGSLTGWERPLPLTVAALAVGFAAGLILTTHALVDPRRRP